MARSRRTTHPARRVAAGATAVACIGTLTCALLGGCTPPEPPPATAVTAAIVAVAPLQGRSVQGALELAVRPEGLAVTGEFSGLKGARQDFRVHRLGDCSEPRGRSAGEPYTWIDAAGREIVSLVGSTEPDASGETRLQGFFRGARLNGPRTLIGRSIVVHRVDRDERGFETATRVGCGVIGIAAERL